jgi:hypothetical protein
MGILIFKATGLDEVTVHWVYIDYTRDPKTEMGNIQQWQLSRKD